MRRKSIINALLILCMLYLTACTKETGVSEEATSVTNTPKEEEFLVVSAMDTTDEVNGYAIDFGITRWSMEEFDGQVKEVSDIICQQFIDYNPLSSKLPSCWAKEFDSSSEILKYLGCDMIIIPTWDLEETMSTLSVYGDEEGNFEKLFIEVDYLTDNLRMQSFAHVLTESNNENSFLYGSGNYETNVQEEGITPDGFQYIVITTDANSYGYISKDGFLIKNGVFYNFHLAYTAEYEQEAAARLEQWFKYF